MSNFGVVPAVAKFTGLDHTSRNFRNASGKSASISDDDKDRQ